MTTVPIPSVQSSELEARALIFAQAHHRWLILSAEPDAWTRQDRQRPLAAAFLTFHAAKLALSEITCELSSGD